MCASSRAVCNWYVVDEAKLVQPSESQLKVKTVQYKYDFLLHVCVRVSVYCLISVCNQNWGCSTKDVAFFHRSVFVCFETFDLSTLHSQFDFLHNLCRKVASNLNHLTLTFSFILGCSSIIS